jgi:hypothetical protein
LNGDESNSARREEREARRADSSVNSDVFGPAFIWSAMTQDSLIYICADDISSHLVFLYIRHSDADQTLSLHSLASKRSRQKSGLFSTVRRLAAFVRTEPGIAARFDKPPPTFGTPGRLFGNFVIFFRHCHYLVIQ